MKRIERMGRYQLSKFPSLETKKLLRFSCFWRPESKCEECSYAHREANLDWDTEPVFSQKSLSQECKEKGSLPNILRLFEANVRRLPILYFFRKLRVSLSSIFGGSLLWFRADWEMASVLETLSFGVNCCFLFDSIVDTNLTKALVFYLDQLKNLNLIRW